jgi:hypothetical protein
MDPEVLRELQDALKQYNDLLSKQNAALSGMAKAANDATVATRSGVQSDKNIAKSATNLSSKFDALSEAEQAGATATKESSANFTAALGSGRQSVISFTGALLSAETGITKYGNSVDSLGQSALSVGKNFGILGIVLGGAAAAFGKISKEVFKLDDNIINFRDSFTKTAGVLPMTTDQIGKLASRAGFSVDDMKKLSKTTTDLGGKLMGLGGTAGEGAERLMAMADVGDDVRKRFGRLGVTQQDLLDMQAKYVDMQNASGLAMQNRSKSDEQIKQASIDYADNLLKMQTLTGKKADQLQADRDAAMQTFEEQAATMAENRRIQELRAQAAAGGPGADAAAAEAKRIETEQTKRKNFITVMTDTEGKETAMALAKIYRTGALTKDTAGYAALGGLQIVNKHKASAGTLEDALDSAKELERATKDNVGRMDVAYQQGGETLARKMGVNLERILLQNQRGNPDLVAAYKAIEAKKLNKETAGTDLLADTIEDIRATERNAKKVYQGFLESIDPLRGSMEALKFAAIAATATLGAILTGKMLSKLPGIGGIFSGKSKGIAAVSGAASAESTAMNNLNKVAGSGGGMIGGFLNSVVEGLTVAGAAAPEIALGGAAIGAAIAAIGVGLAAATAIIGVALPALATGLQKFNKVNGPNLAAVGLGMAGLGAGVAVLGAGKVLGAIGNIANFFTGGGKDDPIKNVSDQVDQLGKYTFNPVKVKNNSDAIVAFSRAMAEAKSLGAIGSMAALGGAVADSVAGLFKTPPPFAKFVEFSGLDIDEKKTERNTKAFVNFANAMSSYRGGPGLSSAISSLAGAGLNKIFGRTGPIESFVRFAKMDFGPKAGSNADAFLKYAQAMGLMANSAKGSAAAPAAQAAAPAAPAAAPAAGAADKSSAAATADSSEGKVIFGDVVSNKGSSVPKAAQGGIFDSSNASFPTSNLGKKLAPLSSSSIIATLAGKNASDTISKIKAASLENISEKMQGDDQDNAVEMYYMIQDKLGKVLSALEHTHSTQNKILQHSMV